MNLPDVDSVLDLMTPEELRALTKRVREIQYARRMKRHVETSWRPAMEAMSNVMLGFTHAAACRAHLRATKGLRPFATFTNSAAHREPGGTPAHGRMWTAHEGAISGAWSSWIGAQHPNIPGVRLLQNPLWVDARTCRNLLHVQGYSWKNGPVETGF